MFNTEYIATGEFLFREIKFDLEDELEAENYKYDLS
jgi:hypothetical protein